MSFSTVIVCVPKNGRPYEIHRDARDPINGDTAWVERLADNYSTADGGRLVRIYPDGLYVKPWRQIKDPVYEAFNGKPTPDFRTVSS